MAWYDDYQAPAQKGLGSFYGMRRGPYGLQGGYMPGDLLKGQLGGFGGGMGGPLPPPPDLSTGPLAGLPDPHEVARQTGGPAPGTGGMPFQSGYQPQVDENGRTVLDPAYASTQANPGMARDPGMLPNPYTDPSGFETWLKGQRYGPSLQEWQSRLNGANPVFAGSMNTGMGQGMPGLLQQQLMRGY